MNRIGFIGLDELSEGIIRAIFSTVTEMQVFLYPSDCSHVQKVARVYPCWTLDDCKSVSEESELVFLSTACNNLTQISENLHFNDNHTVVSLNPNLSVQQLRLLFPRSDCVRMTMIALEDSSKTVTVFTDNNQQLQQFLCEAGLQFIAVSENHFNLILMLAVHNLARF